MKTENVGLSFDACHFEIGREIINCIIIEVKCNILNIIISFCYKYKSIMLTKINFNTENKLTYCLGRSLKKNVDWIGPTLNKDNTNSRKKK